MQETNQLPIFSEITKYQAHVCSPARMAELTNRCFHYAQLERGPVQLNIPRDMFYGEVETKIPAPQTVESSAGGPAALERAAELLAKARNPVIVAGKLNISVFRNNIHRVSQPWDEMCRLNCVRNATNCLGLMSRRCTSPRGS